MVCDDDFNGHFNFQCHPFWDLNFKYKNTTNWPLQLSIYELFWPPTCCPSPWLDSTILPSGRKGEAGQMFRPAIKITKFSPAIKIKKNRPAKTKMFRPAIKKVLPGYHQIISIKILTFKPHFARLPGNFNYEFQLLRLTMAGHREEADFCPNFFADNHLWCSLWGS